MGASAGGAFYALVTFKVFHLKVITVFFTVFCTGATSTITPLFLSFTAPTEVVVLPFITLTTPAWTKSSFGKVVIPESKWRSETKLGNSLAVDWQL